MKNLIPLSQPVTDEYRGLKKKIGEHYLAHATFDNRKKKKTKLIFKLYADLTLPSLLP